jgi:hypothetical protein
LKLEWLKHSFIFSLSFFAGIECINYLASINDWYKNPHLTATIAALGLQPVLRRRILKIEGHYE